MPLYGIDQYGELYEQNSVTDNGFGQKKKIKTVDEGSVTLKKLSLKEAKAKKQINAQAQLKSKVIKKQKAKMALQLKKAESAMTIKKAVAQRQKLKSKMIHEEKMYDLYSEAMSQPQLGSEYSGIYGSPHDGFDCEGFEGVVQSLVLYGRKFKSLCGAITPIKVEFQPNGSGIPPGMFQKKWLGHFAGDELELIESSPQD
jgi:hypothetical protein